MIDIEANYQDYSKVIFSVTRSYSQIGRRFGLTQDDLASESWKLILSKTFDPSRGASKTTFIYSMARYACLDAINKAKLSFVGQIDNLDLTNMEAQSRDTDSVDIQDLASSVSFGSMAVDRYVNGYQVKEIAAKHGICREMCRKRICNAIEGMRKKCK